MARRDKYSRTDPTQFETIEDRRKGPDGKVTVRKYLKGRLLGKGGFAHCYWASCVETGNIYAMKIVEKSSLTKRRAKEKLQGEIRIHRKLNHPNVVEFFNYFEDRKRVYIVLGLCPNHSMSDLMKRRKRLSELEVRYYGKQLLSALKYLHEEKVIHRDLKLGNLFLDKDMCIQVGDFGLAAKVTDVHERKRTICGTPNYIAPEILENKNGHSFQVDVWSFGVIIYTWLVGKPPYEARDVKATYRRIVSNVYSFPEHVSISDEAKSIIRRMLQLKPHMRPSLEEIEAHPFFLIGPEIPMRLPESALSSAPSLADCMIASRMAGISQPLATSTDAENVNLYHKDAPYQKTDDAKSAPKQRRKALGTLDLNVMDKDKPSSKGACDKPKASERAPRPILERARSVEGVRTRAQTHRHKKFDIYNDFEAALPNGEVAPDNFMPPNPPLRRSLSAPRGATVPAVDDMNVEVEGPRKRVAPKPVVVSPENSIDNGSDTKTIRSSTSSQPDPAAHEQLKDNQLVRRSLDKNGELDKALALCGNNDRKVADSGVDRLPTQGADIENFVDDGCGTKMDKQDKDTLEAMHDRLSHSLADHAIDPEVFPDEGHLPPKQMGNEEKGLWVIRYVDYTSKYGLGFLLSNGSAGVYFNDATKIVISPSGKFFDYIERSRSGTREMIVERHMIENYPSQLQKKVTLLNHFSNYLIQQEKRKLEEGRSHIPSSVNLDDREKNIDGTDLVYVKKWVKTRHAILFRLSSRTVQVTFFDQTEITLSSEARAVMYIDKYGNRSKHTLLGVLRSGRQDMIKRLKYTKDILHQLISQQQASCR